MSHTWSSMEIHRASNMHRQGSTPEQIARALKTRTADAVERKLTRLHEDAEAKLAARVARLEKMLDRPSLIQRLASWVF